MTNYSFKDKLALGLSGAALGALALVVYQLERHVNYYETVGRQVFKLVSPSNHGHGGTGFAINLSGKTYTLTNAHICDIAENNTLHAIVNNRTINVTVVERSPDADLCLVSAVPNLAGLSLSPTPPYQSQDIVVLGNPYLQPKTSIQGQVTGKEKIDIIIAANVTQEQCEERGGTYHNIDNPFMIAIGINSLCDKVYDTIRTTLVIYPGNSGSPIVNLDGEVVSVLFAGDGRTNWGFGVTNEDLNNFLRGYQ